MMTPDLSFGIIVKFGIHGIVYSLYVLRISGAQRSTNLSMPAVAMLLKVESSPVSKLKNN
ncbi:hypothetical protein D3C84_967540 [compost metagenome]